MKITSTTINHFFNHFLTLIFSVVLWRSRCASGRYCFFVWLERNYSANWLHHTPVCVFSQLGRFGNMSKLSPTFSWKYWSKELLWRRLGASFRISLPLLPEKTVTITFEYLVGVSSKAASKGIGKKPVWIYIQKTHEYLTCVNQVSPTSSQISRMKTQPLQPLFVVEETIIIYQPCSYSLNSL